MSLQERRLILRKDVKVPLKFRPTETTTSVLETTESLNLSERGIFFSTSRLLRVGMPLELFLTMPSEITGRAPAEVRCTARVVHVQPNAFPRGKAGIGARIERCEPIAAEGQGKK